MMSILRLVTLFGTALVASALAGHVVPKEPSPASSPTAIYATDLNADNKPDVITATSGRDRIAWHRQNDGTFRDRSVITDQANGAHLVTASDLDNDGDKDVLSASRFDDTIAWYENTNGYGRFSSPNVITTQAGDPQSLFAADLDDDGDTDLLYCSWDEGKIAWYENTDGAGTFSDVTVISNNVGGAEDIYAADLDGDGDKDALSASSSVGGTNKIAWYRNTAGGFASQNVISQNLKRARAVLAADVDGDADQDVLSASAGDGKIAWYENTNGYGTFSKQKLITTGAEGVQSLSTADLDGDGDLDVLSASKKNGTLAWYENTNGSGDFSGPKVISEAARYTSVFTKDLDGDGDPDVLAGTEDSKQVAWFSNDIEQEQGFGTAQSIVRQIAGAK